jgi:hypothetical protein
MHSDTTENNASSVLYRRLKNTNKNVNRTVYYG